MSTFFLFSSSLLNMKKADFLKMLKTHQLLNVFGPLENYAEKSVRGGYFLPQIMKVAFFFFLLFLPSPWLRLGDVFVIDTLQALVCVALCRALLFKMCISSRQNA